MTAGSERYRVEQVDEGVAPDRVTLTHVVVRGDLALRRVRVTDDVRPRFQRRSRAAVEYTPN
jgi:hypothetical protein